jgi:hypothetical protein
MAPRTVPGQNDDVVQAAVAWEQYGESRRAMTYHLSALHEIGFLQLTGYGATPPST